MALQSTRLFLGGSDLPPPPLLARPALALELSPPLAPSFSPALVKNSASSEARLVEPAERASAALSAAPSAAAAQALPRRATLKIPAALTRALLPILTPRARKRQRGWSPRPRGAPAAPGKRLRAPLVDAASAAALAALSAKL